MMFCKSLLRYLIYCISQFLRKWERRAATSGLNTSIFRWHGKKIIKIQNTKKIHKKKKKRANVQRFRVQNHCRMMCRNCVSRLLNNVTQHRVDYLIQIHFTLMIIKIWLSEILIFKMCLFF